MASGSKWKTPFTKQCFATLGVTLSTMGDAYVVGFASVLLPQLRHSEDITLSSSQESWIASIVGLSIMIGILIVPSIMGKFGRRAANAIANGVLACTWLGLALPSSYNSILFIRFLQGVSVGMTSILAPIIVGEYTSPKYRGAFLTTIALSFTLGVLVIHCLSIFFNWKEVSFIFAAITVLDCIIIMGSPETPSFLATVGRYDECRKAFNWLRYPEEKHELDKLIKENMRNSKVVSDASGVVKKMRATIKNFVVMVKKKEFYKPVILMFHLHIINEWSASNLLDSYTVDIYEFVIGNNVNAPLIMISTDICKLLSNCLAIVMIRRVSRRRMLAITTALNVLSLLLIASHVYAKTLRITTFDYPMVGIILIHFLAFTIAVGTLPLPNIIAGEIFSLEYRGISSMVTLLFYCVNLIINVKTALFLFFNVGLHRAFLLYAGLVGYGLVVSMIMLPETKDRTLQDIEEEFRGEKKIEDLTSFIAHPEVELKDRE